MSKEKGSKEASKVGYRSPPVHSQFQPGKSGNRRGRPKLSRDLEVLVRRAVSKKAMVTVGGRRRRLTKLEIALDQLANKSASGDIRATLTIAQLLGYPKKKAEEPPQMVAELNRMEAKLASLSDEDFQAMVDLFARLGISASDQTE